MEANSKGGLVCKQGIKDTNMHRLYTWKSAIWVGAKIEVLWKIYLMRILCIGVGHKNGTLNGYFRSDIRNRDLILILLY